MFNSVGFVGLLEAFLVISQDTSTSTTAQFAVPTSGEELISNIEDPIAINAQTVCPGYIATDTQNEEHGFKASLKLAGVACNVYGTDVEYLNLTVQYQSVDRLNVNIVPTYLDASNISWYLLSESLVPKPATEEEGFPETDLMLSWSNEPSFGFKVIRKATGDIVFDTEGTILVFEDQFIELVSALPENYNLYGLGERIHGLRLGNNFTATIYAADAATPIDRNIYGVHPFYLDTRYYEVDSSGVVKLKTDNETDRSKEYLSASHGVFLRNAHGQEVLLRTHNITWRTIGGSIDLYFYSGPTQQEVTKSYQISTVGLPAMQQYFTLGYHQCRWGYSNWSQLAEVVANFERFEIPLENIWSDIDYMKLYRDFENDPVRFSYSEGGKFLDKIHQSGRHWIPIVDAAIWDSNPENVSDVYPTHERGSAEDVWLKDSNGSIYVGDVWPGYSVFPDWHHPKAKDFWTNELLLWYQKVPYDGIWLDMNEASSFCVGSCRAHNLSLGPVHPPFALPGPVDEYPEGFEITNSTKATLSSRAEPSASETPTPGFLRTKPTPGIRNVNYPPYVINHVQRGHDLAVKAISPNATHADGVLEYDVHNLWGYQETEATYHALLNVFPGKRPFIITRSTFAGSGQWAGHWGGDNVSKWANMYFSISHALSFSLFGIPMFGVDTCGFYGNSDMELCSRWMQLSAFFPFYRNHNVLAANPQEPYVWASVIDSSKTAMKIRYALLPYLYTLFYLAHTTGSTVMRALSWEFPNDPSLASIDTQFLLGPSLMVVPVLEPQMDTVKGIFPGVGTGENWYDWYTQEVFDAQPGVNTTIAAPLGHIPVFVRGGSVLPMQQPAQVTRDVRNSPWSLLVTLSNDKTAAGQLYVDDGESLIPSATLYIDFAASGSNLFATSRGSWKDHNPLANVTVLGVSSAPSSITFKDKRVPADSIFYNSSTQVLVVSKLQNFTQEGAWSESWILKW
ncbi:hypothetical protein Egran_06960 [Elaphomyces granulatus]|uniref:alpha-glucosidase n=1 Tax=Elaphomyces granulatus TaxID=519963 RepID=A0A232LMA3_9EURO|nr:hypothetical protein Egran_06960 [Elaphomyces granulatus]